MSEQEEIIKELTECLEWYVEEDDVIEGDSENSYWIKGKAKAISALRKSKTLMEQQKLRELCATAYQVVGAAGGPVELLDNLYAASNGDELPHSPDAGLPWVPVYAIATDADIDLIKSMISSRIFTDEYTEKLNDILKIISK
jgi:hypothetical protein